MQIQPLIQLSMAAEQAEQLQQQEEAAAALHQQQHTTPVTTPQTPIVNIMFYLLQLKLFFMDFHLDHSNKTHTINLK